jgi:hypothetical protein
MHHFSAANAEWKDLIEWWYGDLSLVDSGCYRPMQRRHSCYFLENAALFSETAFSL